MTLICAQCLQIIKANGDPSGKYVHRDNNAIKPHTCNTCLAIILEREGMSPQGVVRTIQEVKANSKKGIVRRIR